MKSIASRRAFLTAGALASVALATGLAPASAFAQSSGLVDVKFVISHRSAAHLRGLGDLIPYEHEFYATTRLRPRRNDIKLRIRSQIPPGSWEIWSGLPARTVPAIIDDLLSDGEDESAVAQVVRDALALGLLRDEALNAIVAPYAVAYGHTNADEFAQVLTGEGTLG